MVLTDIAQPSSETAATLSNPAELTQVCFNALGTECSIQFHTTFKQQGDAYAAAAIAWVNSFEAKYSRFRADSLIGRINASAGHSWVETDEEAEHMFALADHVVMLTQGILDPTALPLLKLWNFKAQVPRIPDSTEVSDALKKVGWSLVQREPGRIFLPIEGMGLDLGGFGKEYAVDQVAQLALNYGIENVLVDFGHDVRVFGAPVKTPVWSIGVEDPNKPGHLRGQLLLNHGGVATSGDYLRNFELNGKRYGHIIDPRTGYPVSNECLGVTAVADTCLEAGLLSTTAFVLGAENGIQVLDEYFGAEGSIATENHELQTRGFHRYAM